MARVSSSQLRYLQVLSLYLWEKEEENLSQVVRRRLRVLRRRRARFRQQFLFMIALLGIGLLQVRSAPWSVWVREMNSNWWSRILLETFGPHDWIENVCMRKETFTYLCNAIRHVNVRSNTRFQQAITIEKRVAITLWCLATPCEYRTLAHLFGVTRSTVCTIVHETCEAIILTLMETYIKFPSREDLKR